MSSFTIFKWHSVKGEAVRFPQHAVTRRGAASAQSSRQPCISHTTRKLSFCRSRKVRPLHISAKRPVLRETEGGEERDLAHKQAPISRDLRILLDIIVYGV